MWASFATLVSTVRRMRSSAKVAPVKARMDPRHMPHTVIGIVQRKRKELQMRNVDFEKCLIPLIFNLCCMGEMCWWLPALIESLVYKNVRGPASFRDDATAVLNARVPRST